MGLGGVAALAGVQVEHHGVVGVGDGGGVAPGVLGVKHQVVLGGAAEGRALLPQLRLQSAGQCVAALGLPQAAVEHLAVHQVAEVEIGGGEAHPASLHVLKEGLGLLGRGLLFSTQNQVSQFQRKFWFSGWESSSSTVWM